jgi:ABC-2 type transport system ATP-binding protein
MIVVSNLSKNFYVHKKVPGLMGSLKSLIRREKTKKEALKNINLKIDDGEIIGLIGSNGAGKTTLTKILSGIIHPSHGEVSVLGFNPWKRDNKYRQQMALIMGQKQQLWWDLPALDGFLLLKEIYQIPDHEYDEMLNYLSEKLDIKNELNVQVRKLSLGERMKVELMAALLHRPKVVYLDEPTIGLDLMAQKAVREFIKEYRKRFNPIMILTSHYMDDIEELCERIVVLKKGEIVYDGDLQTVIDKYATEKIITANTTDDSLLKFQEGFPQELGTLSIKNNKLEITVPRNKTMEASKLLLNKLHIQDLNIQEKPIGEIIENIMQGSELK